ncbi:MAG: tRNA (N6-isopentenyl adenosine(37)-C2)-methylthiotransferase MiaB [Oscillospiraceae bacterium]
MDKQNEYINKVNVLLKERYPTKILMAYVHSFGCQQNVSDGEKIKGMLALMGYGFSDTSENADLVLYNTCAVRENAQDRIYGNIGRLKTQKEQNPNMVIGLCGCMIQQEHIAQKIIKSYRQVDLVFGTHVLHQFPELLYKTLITHKCVLDISDIKEDIAENMPIKRDGKIKAWVPIMYGCNNFCTYCVVPLVRGREKSREPEKIIEEVEKLVKQGYKEITLLGQNVNSYGVGLQNPIDFSSLLKKVNDIEGEFIIRFMSSHPKDASKKLIDTMSECEKVCHHFHLPVQSGSNEVLEQMNRKYTVEEYMALVDYAREKIPDISFTSDIIIGFPTETHEDVLKTIDLIKKVKFDALFTFIYSPRVGTKAALMESSSTQKERSEWFSELLNEQRKIGKEVLKTYEGKTVRVLADSLSKVRDGFVAGRTDGYIMVDFLASESVIGQFVNIKITEARSSALIGEII